MGGGGYSVRAAVERTRTRRHVPTQKVFTRRGCHPSMDPKIVQFRESRDSAEHPQSVAIAMFLDVTRSMDDIPEGLAKRTLPTFASMVLPFLPHAQILFGAIGDAEDGDKAALQIGQWESDDALVDQWLTRIFLEQGGGDNMRQPSYESYDLALFFAARLARIDCYEKRGQKGYLIITGDECPRSRVSAHTVNRIFGRKVLDHDVPIEQIVKEACEKFHVFFLIPDQERAERCEAQWRALLGDNVIVMEDPEDTALVSSTLIALTDGAFQVELFDFKDRLKREHGCDGQQSTRIYRTVRPYAATRPGFEPRGVVLTSEYVSRDRSSGNVRFGT